MSLQPFLIDFAFPSMQMLYSVYCQLSHSLARVWDDVTHPVAIALCVDRVAVLPSCENVVFQLPF